MWLLSNVTDTDTGRPLAECRVHHTIDWEGRRIGLIGLVEREWLERTATINMEVISHQCLFQLVFVVCSLPSYT